MTRRKLLSPPTRVVVSYCGTCGAPIIADMPDDVSKVDCDRCPVKEGRVRRATYVLQPRARKRKPDAL